MGLTFETILHDQRVIKEALNNATGNACLSAADGEEAAKENILAIMVEATEVLQELNWKSWKQTRKEIDKDKIADELADLLKFYANVMLSLGISEEDLESAWRVANIKVISRIQNGY